jgi:DNA primase small subunit
MDRILRDDFGFEHLFYVFSGRRGIHCWVGDQHARKFETTARSSIISYSSFAAKENMSDGVKTPHFMLKRGYEICLPYFISCSLREQHMLGDPTLENSENERRIMKMLKMIPFNSVREDLMLLYSDPNQTSEERWKILDETFEKLIKHNQKRNDAPGTVTLLRYTRMQIVLHYTYPRLDVEVTRHMNHLLKSPFCVHPKTGKLCVPMDPNNLSSFSPLRVPTLVSLTSELNEALREHQKEQGEKTKIDYRKIPSMKREIDLWKSTFLDAMGKDKDSKMEGLEW